MSIAVRDLSFSIFGRDKTQQAFNAAGSRAAKLGQQVERLQRGFAVAGAAMAAAAGGVALAMRGIINEADKMSKAAQSVGLATEELSKLSWAADLSGVSFEQLTGAMGKLAQASAGSLRSATSEQALAFKALGVEVQRADGMLKDNRALLGEVANRFAAMENSAEKTALAMAIFGRAGKQLIPMLNQGEAGLQAMGDEAERLGIVIDTQTGLRAEAFNDTLNRMGKVMKGVMTEITAGALPTLQAMADHFFLAGAENDRMQAIVSGSIKVFKALSTAVVVTVDAFRLFAEVIGTLWQGAMASSNEEMEAARARADNLGARLTDIIGETSAAINQIWSDAETQIQATSLVPSVEGQLPQLEAVYAGAKKGADKVQDLWFGLRNLGSEAKRFARDSERAMERSAGQMADVFSDAFDQIGEGTFKARDFFADLAKDILRQFMNAQMQQLFGALFSGLSGGLGGGIGAPIQLPMRAMGGPVTAGQRYIVGEKGPETFVPSSNGAVVAGGGETRQTMRPIINITAPAGYEPETRQQMGAGGEDITSVLFKKIEKRYGMRPAATGI